MSIFLLILAIVSLILTSALDFSKKEKMWRTILRGLGVFVTIVAFIGQHYVQVRESAQNKQQHQELLDSGKEIFGLSKETYSEIIKFTHTLFPDLSDNDATILFMKELKKQIEWSDDQQHASIIGVTLPGRTSEIPIPKLIELLNNKEPFIKSFAAICLRSIGTPEAMEALKKAEQNSQK
jgi:hypothetical protein